MSFMQCITYVHTYAFGMVKDSIAERLKKQP
jgi:hypothetical protein